MTDHTGRSVQLAYREGKLEKVTTASGAEYRYAYGGKRKDHRGGECPQGHRREEHL